MDSNQFLTTLAHDDRRRMMMMRDGCDGCEHRDPRLVVVLSSSYMRRRVTSTPWSFVVGSWWWRQRTTMTAFAFSNSPRHGRVARERVERAFENTLLYI